MDVLKVSPNAKLRKFRIALGKAVEKKTAENMGDEDKAHERMQEVMAFLVKDLPEAEIKALDSDTHHYLIGFLAYESPTAFLLASLPEDQWETSETTAKIEAWKVWINKYKE